MHVGRWILVWLIGWAAVPRVAVAALPPAPLPVVRSDEEFLDVLQRTAFQYFWEHANPDNGLVRDRSTPTSKCSIAATGFGLSALPVGIDRGWITRAAGRARVLTTLRTLARLPQGPAAEDVAGHRGWFYHFLEMETGLRAWKCELSSIDTALLLAGVLDAAQYFTDPQPDEVEIRRLASLLLERVDWHWMRNGADSLSMGWHPEKGFIGTHWVGYNEAMILYLLGLGVEKEPLEASAWAAWTSGYVWTTQYGQSFVEFPPLFGHQYSHVWVDFRGLADPWLQARGIDYFENSRRATLAQHAYALDNPMGWQGYGPFAWGLTACDGPGRGRFRDYSARGAPPVEFDDGTLAPTAVGASVPFAPDICLPTLRHYFDAFGDRLWTRYGFRDAFNLEANWWGPDVLGIDQGPILLMLENHRTGRVWSRVTRHPVIQRGLRRAGFQPVLPRKNLPSP